MFDVRRDSLKVLAFLAVVLGIGTAFSRSTWGCDLCGGPVPTLMEQFEKADAVVAVAWSSGRRPSENVTGQTTYRILKVLRDSTGKAKVGDELTVDRFRRGTTNHQFLLMATRGDGLEWGNPEPSTPALVDYLAGAPREAPGNSRLPYFLKYLEHADEQIAKDAYSELSNAPYQEIAKLSSQLPREKIAKWVTDAATPQDRLALYGLMLGLCGRESDGPVLEKRILQSVEKGDFRLGIQGLMGGYLLLTGERGLEKLELAKLKDPEQPYSEVFAVVQAMRFMWVRAPGKIAPDRLRASLRILLTRPDMADIVITDLTRWRDWSIQERLVQLYGQGDYNLPSTRRAIIRYLLVSQRDAAAGAKEVPVHVTRGKEFLEAIRKKDPKMVADVERFPVL